MTRTEDQEDPPYTHVALRCGGGGGKCGKVSMVPRSAIGDHDALTAQMTKHGWGMIVQNYDIPTSEPRVDRRVRFVDLACPLCFAAFRDQVEIQAAMVAAAEQTRATIAAREVAPTPDAP